LQAKAHCPVVVKPSASAAATFQVSNMALTHSRLCIVVYSSVCVCYFLLRLDDCLFLGLHNFYMSKISIGINACQSCIYGDEKHGDHVVVLHEKEMRVHNEKNKSSIL